MCSHSVTSYLYASVQGELLIFFELAFCRLCAKHFWVILWLKPHTAVKLVFPSACCWLALERGPPLLLGCWAARPPQRWSRRRTQRHPLSPLKEVYRWLWVRNTKALIDLPRGQTDTQILPGNVRGSFPEERTFELNHETWVRILADCAGWGEGSSGPDW